MSGTQLKELGARVLSRAREDAAFRDAVRADPRAAVEQEFGVTLPADLDLDGVRDRTISRFQAQPADADELSDEELEAVAGGEKLCIQCSCMCACGPERRRD